MCALARLGNVAPHLHKEAFGAALVGGFSPAPPRPRRPRWGLRGSAEPPALGLPPRRCAAPLRIQLLPSFAGTSVRKRPHFKGVPWLLSASSPIVPGGQGQDKRAPCGGRGAALTCPVRPVCPACRSITSSEGISYEALRSSTHHHPAAVGVSPPPVAVCMAAARPCLSLAGPVF